MKDILQEPLGRKEPPRSHAVLEREPQDQVDFASMAVIDLVGLVEHWVPGDQVVAGDSGSNRTHAAERTRRELRVVKRVVERGAELDHFGLSNRKPLTHADIEVVDASQRQRVPPTVRVNSGTGLNVASVRIVGQVSDHVPIAVEGKVLEDGFCLESWWE